MVVVLAPVDDERSIALALQLSIPLVHASAEIPRDCVAYLQFVDSRLQLFPVDAQQSGPIAVDFVAGATAHRLRGAGELIVKAVKGRSKGLLRVLDATAGLGRDSAVLAGFGFNVTLLEREPIVAALLADGLARAAQSDDARLSVLVSAMRLHCVDASTYLNALAAADSPDGVWPDVIYLDPMFPPSDKSALVKKEMRLFQQLFHSAETNGVMEDYSALLSAARACARLRVVVKRPRKADALAGQAPDYSLEGKAVRFDIYISANA